MTGNGGGAAPTRAVPVPGHPLSLWLRLAHVHRVGAAEPLRPAPLRVLSDFELVFQVEGSSWVWSEADGGSVDIRTGDVAFLPPGFVHAWGGARGTHIAVHFDLHARPEVAVPENIRLLPRTVRREPIGFVPRFALLREGLPAELVIPLVSATRVPGLWREELSTLVDLWSRRRIGALDADVRIAAVLGFALRDLAVDPPGPEHDAEARIVELVKTLDSLDGCPLGERPQVADLAGRVHMAETTFRAAFARIMGRSPRRYLEERRMERAALALVDTNLAVTEISREMGYPDPYHFSRVFRRVMGQSPRLYRQTKRADVGR